MVIRCFWPPDNCEPLSPTEVLHPSGRVMTKLWMLESLAGLFDLIRYTFLMAAIGEFVEDVEQGGFLSFFVRQGLICSRIAV
jgi:hypothetical protein